MICLLTHKLFNLTISDNQRKVYLNNENQRRRRIGHGLKSNTGDENMTKQKLKTKMKLSQHIFMDYAGMHDKNSTCNGNKLTFFFGRNGFTKALRWNFERMNIMLGTKYILFL